MKKLSLLSIFVFITTVIFGQSNGSWCATDEELNAFHEANPEMRVEYEKEMMEFAKTYSQTPEGNKNNTQFIIPVVVHVIHYNGQGNISKAQIEDGIRILNEDFQKLNADTSAVRSVFQPYIADLDIQFRLARIDPNGICTEGITRTNSELTFDVRNEPKNLIGWDPYSYLNVWIVNSIRGGVGSGNVLGFAQFPPPSSGAPSTYGLVVRSDEWGSIEAASGTDGRTVTHEVGHCLNLYHTFQSSCGSFCQGSGDFICDTPPQFDDNNNSCNFSLNTCSNDTQGGIAQNQNPYSSNVPDQLENYMGYGLSCLGMFTDGQKSRVYAAINAYSKLSSLTDPTNNIQTGTHDGFVSPDCVPTPIISELDKFVCEGGTVTFSEESYGGPKTTYSWSFPGGTPSSSTQANPTITYNTPGTYDITLRVGNASGLDSLTISDYVHVGSNNSKYLALNYFEGFENTTSFPNDWVRVSRSGSPQWQRIAAGLTGSNSIWVNNFNNNVEGGTDQIISPSINMTNVSNPTLSFYVSYRKRNSSSNDRLNLKTSIDCGETWSTVAALPANYLANGRPAVSSNYAPSSAADWFQVNIQSNGFSSAVLNSDNVMFMFELENGGGNNIFIDDIEITGQIVGVDENVNVISSFMMFPNPAKDNLTIQMFASSSAQSSIYIMDVMGKKVKEIYKGSLSESRYEFNIDTKSLESGIYFVTLQTDEGRKTEKLIIR